MTQWYYVDPQQQRHGPVSAQALVQQFQLRALDMASLVWREGMDHWQPLRNVAPELGLATPPAAPPSAPVAEVVVEEEERPLTGRAVFTARDPDYAQHAAPHASQADAVAAAAMAQAAYAPQASVHDTASPYAAPNASVHAERLAHADDAHVVYAGFWKRVAASLIDSFAIGIPLAVIMALYREIFGGGFAAVSTTFDPIEQLISILLTASVVAWFHSSLMATPGKLAIGIKVVRPGGESISFLRAFARYWGYILSSLLLCIGLVLAAFTDRKQALHDLMCDTLVVDKWAFTRQPERQRETLGTVAIVVLALGGILLLVGLAGVILMIMGLAAMAG